MIGISDDLRNVHFRLTKIKELIDEMAETFKVADEKFLSYVGDGFLDENNPYRRSDIVNDWNFVRQKLEYVQSDLEDEEDYLFSLMNYDEG